MSRFSTINTSRNPSKTSDPDFGIGKHSEKSIHWKPLVVGKNVSWNNLGVWWCLTPANCLPSILNILGICVVVVADGNCVVATNVTNGANVFVSIVGVTIVVFVFVFVFVVDVTIVGVEFVFSIIPYLVSLSIARVFLVFLVIFAFFVPIGDSNRFVLSYDKSTSAMDP